MLKNMGQVTYQPGCTVNFPDGTKFLTLSIYQVESIEDSKLFQLLMVYSIPKSTQTWRFYNPLDESAHIPDNKELDVSYQLPTLAKFKNELLIPTKMLAFILKFTLFSLCIVASLMHCCCYWPAIRMCLDNSWFCCCFKKVESIKHPIPREKIKGILKTSLTKAKSTSDLLLSSVSKYAPIFPWNNLSPSSKFPIDLVKFSKLSPAINPPPSDSDDNMVVIQKDQIKMFSEPSQNEIQDWVRARFLPNKDSLL